MVVNKSSATNNTTPAAKEKYAASTTTSATVRLFVMTISCVWKKTSHHMGSDDRTQSFLFVQVSDNRQLAPMMGYGLRVPIISAQARATAESGEAAPGIVAHPPFSTNVPRSQV
jgi:hypothetical protein